MLGHHIIFFLKNRDINVKINEVLRAVGFTFKGYKEACIHNKLVLKSNMSNSYLTTPLGHT